jgi:hypothetical protein
MFDAGTLKPVNTIFLRLFRGGSYGGLRYNQASPSVVPFPKEKNDGQCTGAVPLDSAS